MCWSNSRFFCWARTLRTRVLMSSISTVEFFSSMFGPVLLNCESRSAERPPPADGQSGWWDSRCCIQDGLTPVRGNRKVYSSGVNGKCPDPATYRPGSVTDNCAFNAPWSFHTAGGYFCMGDGSVRGITYAAGNQSSGSTSLLEALASRSGGEVVNSDY